MLKNALGAGVVNELVAAHQSLLHRDSTPCALSIWQVIGKRKLLRGSHELFSLRAAKLVNAAVSGGRGMPDKISRPKGLCSFVVWSSHAVLALHGMLIMQ